MWIFLSNRLRQWVLFAFVLPLAGRLLSALGGRIGGRNPRAGAALTRVGGLAARPTRRSRRRAG